MRKVVVSLANDSIMSSRSLRSFRYLKYKNPSTTFDYIGRNRMLQKSEEEEQELSKSYSYRRG